MIIHSSFISIQP